ncbi:NAD dependent epimerase/dehydratase [Xylariaceae sp. FL0255]|nr:NAD dependent epimerase/dehydratase [Xylariaceae sp. FL0255]
MPKVLLTGGSGFIAAHVLEILLQRGHEVVTTVRSEEKAKHIRAAHPDAKLTVVIVPDIAQPGAFDEVMQTPGLDYVQHARRSILTCSASAVKTASPFHYNFTDPKTELLDPAINGTTSLLQAIKKYAPTVKRVIITSSFAAIVNSAMMEDPNKVFSEADWNPSTYEDGITGPKATSYRVSKTLAEKSAWDFKKNESPNFDVATINPPLVLGPVAHNLQSLANVNTSNERVVQLISGKWKANGEIPTNGGIHLWVDVRDVATAHVEAMERPEAGGNRFFVVAGKFSNREFVPIVRENFPDLADKLPGDDVSGGGCPGGDAKKTYSFDNSKATKVLGIQWTPLEKSLVDTVRSLQEINA